MAKLSRRACALNTAVQLRSLSLRLSYFRLIHATCSRVRLSRFLDHGNVALKIHLVREFSQNIGFACTTLRPSLWCAPKLTALVKGAAITFREKR
jgi:hypothetical protein